MKQSRQTDRQTSSQASKLSSGADVRSLRLLLTRYLIPCLHAPQGFSRVAGVQRSGVRRIGTLTLTPTHAQNATASRARSSTARTCSRNPHSDSRKPTLAKHKHKPKPNPAQQNQSLSTHANPPQKRAIFISQSVCTHAPLQSTRISNAQNYNTDCAILQTPLALVHR